jgi:uncharacterized membrane protein
VSYRLVKALALLSSGLLAGAFGYGVLNVAYAFRAVPLDVRLTFHTTLMRMNGPVMQTLMALAVLSAVALAVMSRSVARWVAAAAAVLATTSFLVTRFGNVPINGQMKQWAVTSAPPDYLEILHRWDVFNVIRSACGFVAFLLIIMLAVRATPDRRTADQTFA